MAFRPLNIGLWVAQISLALSFGFFGFLKATGDLTAMSQMMTWVSAVPAPFVRFIGVTELLGAAGMILPAITRIRPGLVPLAAVGFITIQILAIAMHAVRGETSATIALNIPLLALSLFVAWGRGRKLPIIARASLI